MKKIFFFIITLSLLSVVGYAEDINSVILTTNITYPDFAVANVIANKIGAPVLLTSPSSMPTETLNEINDLNITTIYIIGGPVVVNSRIETELKEIYDVTRIWGITRFGTSYEAGKYFWQEGSEKAVLVYDNQDGTNILKESEIVSVAKDLAIQENAPLFLIPLNQIPQELSETLTELGVKNVTIVGSIGTNAIAGLNDLKIHIDKQILGNVLNITKEIRKITRQKQRLLEQIGKSTMKAIVIAVGNWNDMIKAPFNPGKSTTFLIHNESQITELITELEMQNYTEVKVVGNPVLAKTIENQLIANNISTELFSGKPHQIVAQIMRRERLNIKLRKAQYLTKQMHILEKLQSKTSKIRTRCNSLANSINNITTVNRSRTEALRAGCLQALHNNSFIEAIKYEQHLKSMLKSYEWTNKDILTNINNRIQRETISHKNR